MPVDHTEVSAHVVVSMLEMKLSGLLSLLGVGTLLRTYVFSFYLSNVIRDCVAMSKLTLRPDRGYRRCDC